MNYTVKITEKTENYAQADIVELPDVYLHFGHHNFSVVWNKETGRHDSIQGVHSFYGGNMGEGMKFDNWQDAIHSSLYDVYQYCDEFHEGDTFLAEYKGQTQRFVCEGVHVVKA